MNLNKIIDTAAGATPYLKGLNSASTNVQNLIGSELNPLQVYRDHGVHHSCKYDIDITIPTAVLTTFKNNSTKQLSATTIQQRLNMFCIEAYVPQNAIDTKELRVGGEKIEIPYDRRYDEVQMTFYVDGGYKDDGGVCMKLFNSWLDTIYDPDNRVFGFQQDYSSTIKIRLYTLPDGTSLLGKEYIADFILYDAFPSSIQSVSLSGRSNSDITQFNVNWKYRYMKTIDNTRDTSVAGTIQSAVKNGFRLVRSVGTFGQDVRTTYKSVKNVFSSVKDLIS